MADDKKNEFVVVSELPQVSTRKVQANDGKTYDLVTIEEAIKEILEITRELKKGITG